MENNFTAELWDKDKYGEKWEDIKERVLYLENEEFGDKSFPEEWFEKDFKNENTTVVLLKDQDLKIIGYTYACPIGNAFPERTSENMETALIWDTVIEKKWRGKHLVGLMMDRIEDELRKRGYKYVEREARTENNYAANIVKHYSDRIVKHSKPHDSPWGEQIFFRIKL
jgi:ribosomal protein S18 acetylase RimI-like enzyme